MKRPPLPAHPPVRVHVERVPDADLLRRMERWVQKLLEEEKTVA
jgi:hypothetical protein